MVHLIQSPPIVVFLVSFLVTITIGMYLRNRKLLAEIRALEIVLLRTRLNYGRQNPTDAAAQRIA